MGFEVRGGEVLYLADLHVQFFSPRKYFTGDLMVTSAFAEIRHNLERNRSLLESEQPKLLLTNNTPLLNAEIWR